MENGGYLVALIVTVSVLGMLLMAAYWASHRINARRAALGTAEAEPPLPFDESAPADMGEEERLLRVIFGELRRRRSRRESSASDARQSAEERSNT
jgi:hypothetical protein